MRGPRRPPFPDPSEISSLFPSVEDDALFHNKKPGAVTRPGIRVILTDIYFYMKSVTCVKRLGSPG